MGDVAIRVEGLGKRYQLGGQQERYTTLRDQVRRWATSPFRMMRGQERDECRPPFWALRNVSFKVNRGEVIGIIGRNGAGKSTLLKILSRITEPTEGEADLCGRVGSLLEVGSGFHPELTGRENIYLNGAVLGMGRLEITRKFDEIVSFAEVENFIDTPVKHYSSGMYLRLAFAVAAHLEPEILVVDEVLAVGDAQFQKKCLGKIGAVARGGRTVLFVSHNMTAVLQLCTSAVLLRGGRLHAFGRVGLIVSEYMSDAADAGGRFDLTAHPARQRQYTPVMRSLTLSDGSGVPQSVFRPQDPLVAELKMALPQRIREPRVAIAIEDHFGARIMTAANYFNSAPFPELDGAVTVRCQIPRLGLGAGRYLISASVGEKNQPLLDSIDAVGWFTVEWNNNYGTGEEYLPVYGPVLCESQWQVSSAARRGVIHDER